MAQKQYKVQAPDGKVITLEGPEGASPDEVIRQAQALYKPQQATESPAQPAGAPVSDFVGGFADYINPLPLLKAIYEKGPVQVVKDAGAAQLDQFTQAKEHYDSGRYSEAFGHTLAGILPLVGPAAANTGETFGRGDIARGLGQSLAMLAPTALSKVRDVNIPAVLKSKLNPVEQAAVQFGEREGIPLDTATRTGNRAARQAQKLVGESPGGAGISAKARQAQADALTATGERLKNRVDPGLGSQSFTPETAAESVADATNRRIHRFGRQANAAYGELRKIEADPANVKSIQVGTQQAPITQGNTHLGYQTVPVMKDFSLPVDVASVKQALKPLYDELTKQWPVFKQQNSAGLKALSNIINGEDVLSASEADLNLSALKTLQREAKDARNIGLTGKAVSEMSNAVDAAVAQGGPNAVAALKRGRALTRAKYEAKEVLETLKADDAKTFEPVKTFDMLTADNDTRLTLLRRVAKETPQELPKLGRAWMEGLFKKAQEQGGFGRADGLFRDWQNLGNETKTLLFKHPGLVKDLDNFFLVAKKIAENPNPSGTGSAAQLIAHGGLLVANPILGTSVIVGQNALARMLFSPRGSRLLTTGLKVPLAHVPRAAAIADQIIALAGKDAKPLDLAPGVAQNEKQ